MIRIFIGFDSRETIAYHVLAHSIITRAYAPVSITALRLSQLHALTRPREELQSTEFSFSRFLVPWLCHYEGFAVYMDCDMLCLDDVYQLLSDIDYPAVSVVKHKHVPTESTKFLGERQSAYEHKNWSSLMVFNNRRCRHLTPGYVNTAPGLHLHQFKWCDDSDIGELDPRWNHLVGVNEPIEKPAMLHWTKGGCWFPDSEPSRYDVLWQKELSAMKHG